MSAWHTADTSAVEIGLLRLNAPQTAQLLIALLLPLRNQVAISVAVLEKPIVELLGDGFLLVVEIIDVSRAYEDGKSVCESGRATASVRSSSDNDSPLWLTNGREHDQ